MGKSTGSGLAIPSATGNPFVLDWVGEGVFVAANGDTIEFSGGGKIFLQLRADGLFEASWVGQFEIGDIDEDGKAGTGRFSNVGPGAEPLDVIAINDPFALDDQGNPIPGDIWTYDYEITGEMDLGKKKKK
jgi:hypothetical protein